MFIINDIVYGGETEEKIKIINFKILPDEIMLLTFSYVEIDCSPEFMYKNSYAYSKT